MNAEHEQQCDRFDAWLDGELSASGRDVFASHLAECPACREAADEQQWIDELLASEEAAQLEAAPAVVLPVRPRRPWLVAVAAAVAALAAWPVIHFARSERPEEGRPVAPTVQTVEPIAGVEIPSPSPSLPGRGISVATFASAGGAIAVPIDSVDAQVSVVRLYPTLAATRRMARERALAAPPSNGG